MTKLLILDKDGTLVQTASGAQFVKHPQDQVLLPGVASAIARYAAEGWQIAIASNQGGVAAGYKSLEDAVVEMAYCMSLLPDVMLGLFCPDNGDTLYRMRRYHLAPPRALFSCESGIYGFFRKSQPGMLNFAVGYFLNPSDYEKSPEIKAQSLFVGDRPEDEQAAQAANIPFMWAEQWRKA